MNIAATLRTEKSQPNLPTEKAPTGSAHRGDPIQDRKQTRVAGALRATLTLADPNLKVPLPNTLKNENGAALIAECTFMQEIALGSLSQGIIRSSRPQEGSASSHTTIAFVAWLM